MLAPRLFIIQCRLVRPVAYRVRNFHSPVTKTKTIEMYRLLNPSMFASIQEMSASPFVNLL